MNNMVEKKLNDCREDLQELSNNDLLFEYEFACTEVERYRQFTDDYPANEYLQKRFDYEKQVRSIYKDEIMKRMAGC